MIGGDADYSAEGFGLPAVNQELLCFLIQPPHGVFTFSQSPSYDPSKKSVSNTINLLDKVKRLNGLNTSLLRWQPLI